MTSDPSDDIKDLVRNLLRSIPQEALAGFGTVDDGFRPLRPTPVEKASSSGTPTTSIALIHERKVPSQRAASRHTRNQAREL
jgi:hypothetical protein